MILEKKSLCAMHLNICDMLSFNLKVVQLLNKLYWLDS